jgi:RimJ/RimL family protein N-acetyltransferase
MGRNTLSIETERLVIRSYQLEDCPNWYKQLDKEKQKRPSYSKEGYSKWIQGLNNDADSDKMYNFGIFRKHDGVNVGKIEVWTILRMDYQWAMMGYSLYKQYWKQGYATEAVLAATDAFFNELDYHRIELHIDTGNTPSQKVAKRTGFKFECTRMAFSYENGVWTDMDIYYKNKGETFYGNERNN